MRKFGIGLATLALVVTPTVIGTPQAAEAVTTCGEPRWGHQYHFKDVRSIFRDGREIRYREDYRWYCSAEGYWYQAIYYRGFYYASPILA